MEIEIKKIYKDDSVETGLLESGNFRVYFPELGLTLTGIKYRITKEKGKLKLIPPVKYFYVKREEGGQNEIVLPVVKFDKNNQVWEEVKKAFRKALLADLTPEPKTEETKET